MKPGSNPENVSLIRRFNRYSEQVLKSISSKSNEPLKVLNESIIKSSSALPDLEPNTPHFGAPLFLQNTDRYFSNLTKSNDNVTLDLKTLDNFLTRSKNEILEIQGTINNVFTNSEIFINRVTSQLHSSKNEKQEAKNKISSLKKRQDKNKISELYAESFELSRIMFSLLKPPLSHMQLVKARDIDTAILKLVEKLDSFISSSLIPTDNQLSNTDYENFKTLTITIVDKIKGILDSARVEFSKFQSLLSALEDKEK
ncbi:hypothetical protein BB560_004161 [Smittium megazygosporum]|uniref:Uncharacterized protein n=1 Tax=Smittium megazygosporum TaxID=133381 RepID=A0A2T9Z9Y2_9FUNG|nr:hypothetical protein BB560_004161 [Smittium megazygosporum]